MHKVLQRFLKIVLYNFHSQYEKVITSEMLKILTGDAFMKCSPNYVVFLRISNVQ